MIMYTGSFREVCSHCSLELLTVVDKSVNTMCCGPFREMKSLQLSRPQITNSQAELTSFHQSGESARKPLIAVRSITRVQL